MKFRLRRKQLCFKQAVIMAQWSPNSFAVPAPSLPSSQSGGGHLVLPLCAQGSRPCCELVMMLEMGEVGSLQGACQSLKHNPQQLPGMPMLCRDLEQDQVLPTRVMVLGNFPGLIHLRQESCPQLLALPRCPCHWLLIWGCLMGCALKFWQVVCPG